MVDELYNRTISKLRAWFPRLFGKRRVDPNAHQDQWYETPPWQEDATPTSASFEAKDVRGPVGLELMEIRKHDKSIESPTKTARTWSSSGRPDSTSNGWASDKI